MNVKDLRFKIGGVEVHPLYTELKRKFGKENEQEFFRETIEGSLTFIGADYLLIKNKSIEDVIYMTIEQKDKGQTEAARSLGLSSWQSMRLVVLPQAIKNVLPALANEVVTMVKESSICSVLGMAEIMYTAQAVAGNSYITLSPYVLAAIIYFCINYPASKAIEAIERRMRRGDKQ